MRWSFTTSEYAGPRARRIAFNLLFLVCCAAAVVTLQRRIDPDLFWHLRGGMDILKNHKIVLGDSWTYLFSGHPWVNQQWLTEVIFYSCYSKLGFLGLNLLKGLIACAIVLVILRMLKGYSREVRFLSAAIFVAGTLHYFIFRTHLFSLLCTAILLYLLERVSPKARLIWIVVLFAAWANLHALFGLGLMILGIYVLVRWLQGGCAIKGGTVWEWISLPIACLSTLFNPFGVGVWMTAFAALGNPETNLVTEWWPIWKHTVGQNLGFIFLILIVGMLAALFPKKIHWPSFIVFLVISIMGVMHVRFTADGVIPAMPLVASLLGAVGDQIGEEKLKRLKSASIPVLVGAMLVFASSCISFGVSHPLVIRGDRFRLDYPVRAVSFMKRNNIKGKIFNEYTWGGYLDWELPQSMIFIDGRTAVLLYPRGFVTSWKNAVETRAGWKDTLNEGNPDYALLSADDYLTAQLAVEPDWKEIFRGNISVLYMRKTPVVDDKDKQKGGDDAN